MSIMDLIKVAVAEQPQLAAFGDVRDLPLSQQILAWRMQIEDGLPHSNLFLTPGEATDLVKSQYGLSAAADFARVADLGSYRDLVFDQTAQQWMERKQPEWQRRIF